MGLVNVPNLEIVKAGVEYDISTGKVSFTMEDLADAVKAAESDPAIKAPRLKLGHLSVLNEDAGLNLDDGQPSLGTVQNMHLNDKGNTIIGDYIGVPEWLATIMPSAYPSRSFEGSYNYKSNGTDRKYKMVIKAVALLGVRWPGCATIDDIQTLYGSSLPDGVEIAASAKGGVPRVSFDIAASVNVDDIRRQFYDGPGNCDCFMWVQAVYVDPYEIIVMNEDDDQLERYSYECSPDGEVTFGEGQPVIVQYVPDPLAAGERMRMIACAGKQVAIYASRSESRPDTNPGQKGSKMTPEELRQSVGLPAEATDDEVRAKLAELQGSGAGDDKDKDETVQPTDEPSAQNVDKGGEPTPAAGNGGGQPPAAPANAPDAGTGPGATGPGVQASDGTVTVPAAVWQQIQAGAQQGAEVYTQHMAQDKTETIEKALEKGKIAAAMKPQMESLWDKDPKSIKHLLTASVEEGGLAENLVPVQARGVNPGGDDIASAESDYPREWLAPNELARISAAEASATPGATTSAGRD
jgi:hypothetical protein